MSVSVVCPVSAPLGRSLLSREREWIVDACDKENLIQILVLKILERGLLQGKENKLREGGRIALGVGAWGGGKKKEVGDRLSRKLRAYFYAYTDIYN